MVGGLFDAIERRSRHDRGQARLDRRTVRRDRYRDEERSHVCYVRLPGRSGTRRYTVREKRESDASATSDALRSHHPNNGSLDYCTYSRKLYVQSTEVTVMSRYADGTVSGYADETPEEASERKHREREAYDRMVAVWDRFMGRPKRRVEDVQNHRAQWRNA